MAQRIIIIHGRSTKPAKARHAAFLRKSLIQGLERYDTDKAAKIKDGTVEIDYVYYGDINNRILSQTSDKHHQSLTAIDPHSNNGPCLPDDGYSKAIEKLSEIQHFNRRSYRKVIKENDDVRFVDDIARAVSTLAAISTATILNEYSIKLATADMGAYLMTRKVGSAIRERLQAPLRRSLKRGDDICLISHSMGCIVAYDVLWKFSRMSEYDDVRQGDNRVNKWITLGCPLGEAGVKANLYDASERTFKESTDKHPYKIIGDWENIAAVDDFISHDSTMKDDYKLMTKFSHLNKIRDQKIYNCWAMDGKANPHKFYGYLANPTTAKIIADWVK